MSEATEKVKFSYHFYDEDSGSLHEVNTAKVHDAITADELCEMFIDFMKAAGYSEDSVLRYFKDEDEDERAPW